MIKEGNVQRCEINGVEWVIPRRVDGRVVIAFGSRGMRGSVFLSTDQALTLAKDILALAGDEETAAKIRMLLQ